MHARLRALGRIRKCHRQRSVQILPCTACRTEILVFDVCAETARGASTAAKHPTQKIFKASAGAAARPTKAVGPETEAFEVGTTARTVSATRLRTEPFEALETWLAFSIDLAAIECLALVAVADNFICSVEFGEARRCLRIVLVGVRMQFFSESPIGALDIGLACTLGNPQDFVGVAHRIQTPVKSPLSRSMHRQLRQLNVGFERREMQRGHRRRPTD